MKLYNKNKYKPFLNVQDSYKQIFQLFEYLESKLLIEAKPSQAICLELLIKCSSTS